jgi:predicted transcriptional regulator
MSNTMVVSVRMPEELHAELTQLADIDDRPMSREIVHLLRQAVDERKRQIIGVRSRPRKPAP